MTRLEIDEKIKRQRRNLINATIFFALCLLGSVLLPDNLVYHPKLPFGGLRNGLLVTSVLLISFFPVLNRQEAKMLRKHGHQLSEQELKKLKLITYYYIPAIAFAVGLLIALIELGTIIL